MIIDLSQFSCSDCLDPIPDRELKDMLLIKDENEILTLCNNCAEKRKQKKAIERAKEKGERVIVLSELKIKI